MSAKAPRAKTHRPRLCSQRIQCALGDLCFQVSHKPHNHHSSLLCISNCRKDGGSREPKSSSYLKARHRWVPAPHPAPSQESLRSPATLWHAWKLLYGQQRCWSSNTLASWYEEPTHWKRSWFWERLRAGGEGATEDKMVGWHHWLNGHEFEQTLGKSEGQGSLVYCSLWGHKEQTRLSNWTVTITTKVCGQTGCFLQLLPSFKGLLFKIWVSIRITWEASENSPHSDLPNRPSTEGPGDRSA